MNQEYVKLSQVIQTALRSARLDDVVEVEGPNKLGGFRLTDGKHCVSLSRVPEGDLWCVSAWFDVSDDIDPGIIEGTFRPRRREEVVGATASIKDAVMTVIEILIEGRMEDALKESCDGRGEERKQPAGANGRRAVFRTARAFRSRSLRPR